MTRYVVIPRCSVTAAYDRLRDMVEANSLYVANVDDVGDVIAVRCIERAEFASWFTGPSVEAAADHTGIAGLSHELDAFLTDRALSLREAEQVLGVPFGAIWRVRNAKGVGYDTGKKIEDALKREAAKDAVGG